MSCRSNVLVWIRHDAGTWILTTVRVTMSRGWQSRAISAGMKIAARWKPDARETEVTLEEPTPL